MNYLTRARIQQAMHTAADLTDTQAVEKAIATPGRPGLVELPA